MIEASVVFGSVGWIRVGMAAALDREAAMRVQRSASRLWAKRKGPATVFRMPCAVEHIGDVCCIAPAVLLREQLHERLRRSGTVDFGVGKVRIAIHHKLRASAWLPGWHVL